MPHRRIIIEIWGSTIENAQQEVDRVIAFLKHFEYGESSAFVDPHHYGIDFSDGGLFDQIIKKMKGRCSIGCVLKSNFEYTKSRLTKFEALQPATFSYMDKKSIHMEKKS
jgi:hypothetical protein